MSRKEQTSEYAGCLWYINIRRFYGAKFFQMFNLYILNIKFIHTFIVYVGREL